MNMVKSAYRGIEVPSLRNLSPTEIELSGVRARRERETNNTDLLDLVIDVAPDLRTEGQARYMDDLISDLATLDKELGRQAREYTDSMTERSLWTPGRDGNASAWISRLLVKVSELRKAERAKQETVKLEDGMYVLDGEIFKVQHAVHGSGKQYAKRVIPNEPGQKATFIYAPGVVTKLRPEHRMTKDQAKQWGALYGTCVRCGALLTAEDSIDRMMGPVCASKL